MQVTDATELKVGDKVYLCIDSTLYGDSISDSAWELDNSWQEIKSVQKNGQFSRFRYSFLLKNDDNDNVFLWPDFKEYKNAGELHYLQNSKFLSFKELPSI